MKKNILTITAIVATILACCTKEPEDKLHFFAVKKSIFSPQIILGTAD